MSLHTICQCCGVVAQNMMRARISIRLHSAYQRTSLRLRSTVSPISALAPGKNGMCPRLTHQLCLFSQYDCYSTSTMSKAVDQISDDAEPETEPDVFADLDPETAKRLKVLQLERDVWESEGHRVPLNLTNEKWLDILHNYKTMSARRKVYKFWFKKEIYKERAKKQKLENLQKRQQRLEEQEEEEATPMSNSIFQRYSRTRINHQLYMPRLAHAMIHGPHLVVDMSFDQHMTKVEIQNVTKQLMSCHGHNQMLNEPFHLHFCNLENDSPLTQTLFKQFTGLESTLCTTTDKNFLDVYPRENIVYLSPNAPAVMETFDHEAVYVVGGIVDRGTEEPLTFAKAKRENLKCVKFPLDRYLQWVQGKKSLTLDQVLKILWTLKETDSDWIQALQHVPRRKFQWRASVVKTKNVHN